VAFLKRKAGMAHADFVAYYESRHAPLILSIAPQIVGYRRNYLCEEGAIVVQIIGDALVEPNETFTITLSKPSGTVLGDASATVTIINDDKAAPKP